MRKISGLGRTVAAALFVTVPLSALALHGDFLTLEFAQSGWDYESESFLAFAARLADLSNYTRFIRLLLNCTVLITAVFFLTWCHRATKNLFLARIPRLAFKPAAAVYWWFVPLANLVMPALVMNQLSKATRHHARGDGDGHWRSEPVSLLALGWWLAFVAKTTLIQSVAKFMAREGSGFEQDTVAWVMIFGDSCSIVAAILGAILVLRISMQQDAARDREVAFRLQHAGSIPVVGPAGGPSVAAPQVRLPQQRRRSGPIPPGHSPTQPPEPPTAH